jgi:hypothetical protein
MALFSILPSGRHEPVRMMNPVLLPPVSKIAVRFYELFFFGKLPTTSARACCACGSAWALRRSSASLGDSDGAVQPGPLLWNLS